MIRTACPTFAALANIHVLGAWRYSELLRSYSSEVLKTCALSNRKQI